MSYCIISKCKTPMKKLPSVSLHRFPQDFEVKKKWLKQLRGKCFKIDWHESRICSKHFEKDCFDSHKQLLKHAVPTIFNDSKISDKAPALPKFSKMLEEMSNMSNFKIMDDIKQNLSGLNEPSDLDKYIVEDSMTLKCKPNAPTKVKLWVLLKKLHLLCEKSMETEARNKNDIKAFQESINEMRNKSKELENSFETYKYVIKCLQEQQTPLEKQIEKLVADEE